VEEVETSDAEAVGDGVPVEAGGEQLLVSHHALLPGRQSGEQNVGCGQFV
jgi:hypothetical protein